MTAAATVAAVAAGGAAALLLAGGAVTERTAWRPATTTPVTRSDRAVLRRLRSLLATLAFAGCWAFLGGVAGAGAGLLAAVMAWRVLSRAEPPGARRRRDELERDLPTAVHLLGACLEAGAATTGALETVAAALPGAVGDELLLVRHRLALGADPVSVWRQVAGHAQLRPLGCAMVRAHQSGAAVSGVVRRLAAELGAESRASVDARARSVEVRAAAPLGLCLLPACLLLGVVPMVVGVFSAMALLE